MLEILITELDMHGAGVGHADGCEIHVPATLPGERVAVEIEHRSPHASRAWARLTRLLEPSPARRPTPCATATQCGGCQLLHATYEEQLRLKRARVDRALRRYPNLEGIAVNECLPAPAELGYRSVAKYVAARIGGRVVPASYAPRSHRPVDMTACPVPEPEVQAAALAAAAASRDLPVYDERRKTGVLRYVVVRSNARRQVLVVLVAVQDFSRADQIAREIRASCPAVAGVVLDVNRSRSGTILGGMGRTLDGTACLPEELGPVKLWLTPRSFFQVNRRQAERLCALAADLAAVEAGEPALDLYCGSGALSLTLAHRGARVIGVESNPEAVASARRAAGELGHGRCELIEGDVAEALLLVPSNAVAVLDPPRKGCSPTALERLVARAPRRIVYISCAPESLARDLSYLTDRGFRAEQTSPLDLFPGTTHVETVTVLEPCRTSRR